jgi:hypothetical protein
MAIDLGNIISVTPVFSPTICSVGQQNKISVKSENGLCGGQISRGYFDHRHGHFLLSTRSHSPARGLCELFRCQGFMAIAVGCQVCSGADHEEIDALGGPGKRKAADPDKKSTSSRQRSWMSRECKKAFTWRPAPAHRVSCKHWLQNIDNQLQVSTGQRGLIEFEPSSTDAGWTDWRKLPFLAIGMDLGSDGVSAIHACQYLWNLNVEAVPDPAHGANRSIICALKGQGLYPLTLLWLKGQGRTPFREPSQDECTMPPSWLD